MPTRSIRGRVPSRITNLAAGDLDRVAQGRCHRRQRVESLTDVAEHRCRADASAASFIAAPPPDVLARVGRALGVALAGAVNLLDVPAVVLGGIYPRCGAALLDAVRAELTARVVSRPAVDVRFSALGADPALRGVATAVVHDLLADPSSTTAKRSSTRRARARTGQAVRL